MGSGGRSPMMAGALMQIPSNCFGGGDIGIDFDFGSIMS